MLFSDLDAELSALVIAHRRAAGQRVRWTPAGLPTIPSAPPEPVPVPPPPPVDWAFRRLLRQLAQSHLDQANMLIGYLADSAPE
jgi:hypothetical protein